MKTGFLRSWKLVTALAALLLAGGGPVGPGLLAIAEETATADVPAPVSAAQPAPQSAVPTPPDVKLSPGAAEIAKLAQAGLSEDVMLAYVGNVNGGFNLGSDQIVYLNDLGVTETVVKAMIRRDAEYTADAQAWAAANQPPVAPAPPPPVPSDANSYPPPSMDDSSVVNPGDMADYAYPGGYPTTDDSDYFYGSLAPYGTWFYVIGVGLCWQPTVYVGNHDWQPYLDRGRWMYTDCGWYWQSDYSWGWAPFHYGRWFNEGHHGWVWKPDRVWGPAWVSWRKSEDYCGWAPLPPSAHFVAGAGFQFRGHSVSPNFDFGLRANQYTFIPTGRLTDYSPYRYAASLSKATDLYNQSTVINHLTFENNRVVSHGIDPKQVALDSGIQVRTAEIHEISRSPNAGIPSEHMAKQGGTLMIFRPQLSAPATPARPRQFFVPPAGNSGVPRASLNTRTPNTIGSQAVPVYPTAKTEYYPAGSMVLLGENAGHNSQSSISGLSPNRNFAALAPQSRATVSQSFNGYRQERAEPHYTSSQSSIVIPPHFTVASRQDNHSAYATYGTGSPAQTPQHRSYASSGETAPAHQSASYESHATPHAEHYADHSYSSGGSYSHSSSFSSSPSSSFSSSGHR